MTSRGITAALAALTLLLHSLPARAQAAEPGRALSLEDVLQLADQRAGTVALGASGVRQAQARAVGAAVVMPVNPRIAADLRPPITGGAWSDTGYGVTAEASFDVGGAPSARVHEAASAVEAARASLLVARLGARAQAWAAYVRAKAAEMRLAAIDAALEVAGRVLEAMRLRGELGASGDIEQGLARLEVAQLSAAVAEAGGLLGRRTMDLRDAVDLPAEDAIVLTTDLGDPPPAPPAGPLAARALQARPELAEILKRVALLDATDRRLEREIFPRVGVYGGVDAAPISPIFGVVGLSVELPVAQRNQGPRTRIARERDTETLRYDLERRHIEREVRAAALAYEARRTELGRMGDEALPAAERTFELVEMGWRAGRFDVFRMTTAARDLVRVRAQRIDALEQAWLERVELDRAVGGGL